MENIIKATVLQWIISDQELILDRYLNNISSDDEIASLVQAMGEIVDDLKEQKEKLIRKGLTATEKRALDSCPLVICDMQSNLVQKYQSYDNPSIEFNERVIDSLLDKGIIEWDRVSRCYIKKFII